MSFSAFSFPFLGAAGGCSSVILDCERGGTQRQCLFPHCVQPLVCSKQTLIDTLAGQDKNGSGVVGLPGSYLLPGLRLLMVTTYGGAGGGRWTWDGSLTGTGHSSSAWWAGLISSRPGQPRVPHPPAAPPPAASDHGGSISPPGQGPWVV